MFHKTLKTSLHRLTGRCKDVFRFYETEPRHFQRSGEKSEQLKETCGSPGWVLDNPPVVYVFIDITSDLLLVSASPAVCIGYGVNMRMGVEPAWLLGIGLSEGNLGTVSNLQWLTFGDGRQPTLKLESKDNGNAWEFKFMFRYSSNTMNIMLQTYAKNRPVSITLMMMMMISQFNSTSTPKGSYSAKTGVNYPMSLNRIH